MASFGLIITRPYTCIDVDVIIIRNNLRGCISEVMSTRDALILGQNDTISPRSLYQLLMKKTDLGTEQQTITG